LVCGKGKHSATLAGDISLFFVHRRIDKTTQQRARVGIFAHRSHSHLHLLIDSIHSPEPAHPPATMQIPGELDNAEADTEAARARRQAQVTMNDLSTASTRDSDAYMALTDARGIARLSNASADHSLARDLSATSTMLRLRLHAPEARHKSPWPTCAPPPLATVMPTGRSLTLAAMLVSSTRRQRSL
jgi:hypothetical protein